MKIIVQDLPGSERCEDLSDTVVVIPAYNEERRVAETIQTALRAGAGRVVCVNDGSRDRTREILDECDKDPAVDVIHHEVNQGKQAAVKHGLLRALERAGMRRFATPDADMQQSPAELPRLVAPVGEWDVVISLRGRGDMPPARRLANSLANLPYRLIAGVPIRDVQAGFRVYTRDVAEYIAHNLRAEGGYTLEHTTMLLFAELAVKWGRPFRIAEIAVPYTYQGARSSIRIRDNIQLTRASIGCAWRVARALRRRP